MYSLFTALLTSWFIAGAVGYAVQNELYSRSSKQKRRSAVGVFGYTCSWWVTNMAVVASGPFAMKVLQYLYSSNKKTRIERKKQQLRRQIDDIPPKLLADDELAELIDGLESDDEPEKVPANSTAVASPNTAGYRDFPVEEFDPGNKRVHNLSAPPFEANTSEGNILVKSYILEGCPGCCNPSTHIVDEAGSGPLGKAFVVTIGYMTFVAILQPVAQCPVKWIEWNKYRHSLICHECGYLPIADEDCLRRHVTYGCVGDTDSAWDGPTGCLSGL